MLSRPPPHQAPSWSSFAPLQRQSFLYDTVGRKSQASVLNLSYGATQSLAQYQYDADNRLTCTALRMNPNVFASISSTLACNPGAIGSFGPDRISQSIYDTASRVTSLVQGVGTSLGAGTTGPITAQTVNYNPANNLVASVADAKGSSDGGSASLSYTTPSLANILGLHN